MLYRNNAQGHQAMNCERGQDTSMAIKHAPHREVFSAWGLTEPRSRCASAGVDPHMIQIYASHGEVNSELAVR